MVQRDQLHGSRYHVQLLRYQGIRPQNPQVYPNLHHNCPDSSDGRRYVYNIYYKFPPKSCTEKTFQLVKHLTVCLQSPL